MIKKDTWTVLHSVVLAFETYKSGDVSCKSVCHPSLGECGVRVEKEKQSQTG